MTKKSPAEERWEELKAARDVRETPALASQIAADAVRRELEGRDLEVLELHATRVRNTDATWFVEAKTPDPELYDRFVLWSTNVVLEGKNALVGELEPLDIGSAFDGALNPLAGDDGSN